MKKYICDDGNSEIEIEADSAQEAAQEYVDGGSWGEVTETIWISVYVVRLGEDEGERIKVTINPDEPGCSKGEHDWQAPHDIVGGIEENPGVWGHGGGVVIHEVCLHCGCGSVTDTWAQDSSDGEQGLESVCYEPGKYELCEREVA